MKVLSAQFPVLIMAVFAAISSFAEEAKTPVEFPKLEKYAALWERSLFTTKDLPAPDAPAGPSFVDSLGLSGVYELQGEVVALIVDKTTSQVFQAKIGSENEIGVKVRKITGEITDAKVRVQLQKGDQVGWVTLSEDATSSQPAETIAPARPAGLQTRQTPAAAASLLLPQNGTPSAAQVPSVIRQAPVQVSMPAASIPQSPPSTPPSPVAIPTVPVVDGVPLPPP